MEPNKAPSQGAGKPNVSKFNSDWNREQVKLSRQFLVSSPKPASQTEDSHICEQITFSPQPRHQTTKH